ncbi:NADH-quinone oxidoreductase subunit H [Termitidicoccus mucosus]|uniref:complex I subunit 1 family protein n=1 Tax=Termitidicoccus mucosus TaxID=1184151 RepID=UPI0031840047
MPSSSPCSGCSSPSPPSPSASSSALQNRPGPNRVRILGIRFFGFFQPFADAVKALTKEDLVPAAADKILHFLAPAARSSSRCSASPSSLRRHLTPLDLDAGVLYFFAAGAASELVIFMAGWSSQNKYSLLSAMRALAQLISFELPLLLVVVPVVLAAGTLGTSSIVTAQGGWSLGGLIPHWNVLTPGASLVRHLRHRRAGETNRCPSSPRGRKRDHRRAPNRVFGIQIRALLHG